MYNTLNIKDLKFNLLIDIKYPNSNSYINKKDLTSLTGFKTGILDINYKVSKLEFEAIQLLNKVKAFQAIFYTHEKDQYSSNKHIHALLSYKNISLEDIINEITSSLKYLRLIRNGYDYVMCKTLKFCSFSNKTYKDVISKVPFWELKGNDFIYYIAPIVQQENIYTYINKYQKNPYNNLNYIIK
jgi:hypothetical protein